MAEIGERVGAILKLKVPESSNIRLLGYGVYEGRIENKSYPSFEAMFPDFDELQDQEQRQVIHAYEHAKCSHRIKLDSGDLVWGQECIWGPEARIRRSLLGKRVLRVKIVRWANGGFREFIYIE